MDGTWSTHREVTNAYKISVGKHEGRPRRGQEDFIKTDPPASG